MLFLTLKFELTALRREHACEAQFSHLPFNTVNLHLYKYTIGLVFTTAKQ